MNQFRKLAAAFIVAFALILVAFVAASAGDIGTFDQCSNDLGSGYTTGDTGCRWINGDLNRNNSAYMEGDATVQRLWLTGLTAGSHTVTFDYQTSKGGHHAYDFLTTWSFSESWITLADLCQGATGCTGWTPDTLPIPADPYMNSLGVIEPAGMVFTMYNGDLTSATTPQRDAADYSGDSLTRITITFNVDPATAKDCVTTKGVTTCDVLIVFGGHVARTVDWKTQGGGAGTISGSPYHVQLPLVDGAAIGQRDNQMKTDAILPNGTLIIVKQVSPANQPDDFLFTVTGLNLNYQFSLDDDTDPTLSNTETIALPAGTYGASELLPLNWTQTSATCSDGSPVDAIVLSSDETVTCTFNNLNESSTAVSIASFSASTPLAFGTVFAGAGLAGLLGALGLFLRRK